MAETGRRDHGGVVGRELQAGQERRDLTRFASRDQIRPQPAVCRDTTGDTHAPRVETPRCLEHPLNEHAHDDALEARADISDLRPGETMRLPSLTFPDVPENGGFQTAEAEVEVTLSVRRIPVGMGQTRGRERDGAI